MVLSIPDLDLIIDKKGITWQGISRLPWMLFSYTKYTWLQSVVDTFPKSFWWVQCCAKLTCITSYSLIEARPKLVLGRMAQFIFICTLHNQLGQCVDDLWVHQESDPLKHCSSQKFIMSSTQHTYYQTPLSHVKFRKKTTNFGTNKENLHSDIGMNTCGSLIWML